MEMIGDYEIPDSWDAKGMDWENPDPCNADYVMAIREALLERCAAAHARPVEGVYGISPGRALSRAAVAAVLETLVTLSKEFVDLGWRDYAPDYSDFPKTWTYRELVLEPGCGVWAWPAPGSPPEAGGAWLRSVRNVLDILTVVRANVAAWDETTRYGSVHDPPFEESISAALSDAMASAETSQRRGSFPLRAESWSGNTHYRTYKPEYERSDTNCDGWCGYAECRSLRITAARSWLLGAEFDFRPALIAERITEPANYSDVLADSVFDGGTEGWRLGLNWLAAVHVTDPCSFSCEIGDPDSIPENRVCPRGEFDEAGYPVARRSAKTGWTGKVYGFLDYGVENGFRFQGRKEG